jgi:phosphosulfolactate phosphohydrolase-like enzyme
MASGIARSWTITDKKRGLNLRGDKALEVQILKGYDGCLSARGVAVVIDVHRATTTLCCLLQNQPKKIRLGKTTKAITPYLDDPLFECFSEMKTSGAKHDNSPLAALTLQLKDKTAFLVTTNGTVAFDLLKHCERTFAAAFVNLDSIATYLWEINPREVSLIAIGSIIENEEALEDNLCAETIRSRLLGENVDERDIRRKLAKRIRQKGIPQRSRLSTDYSICTAIGIFDVVPEIVYEDDMMWVVDAASHQRSKNE